MNTSYIKKFRAILRNFNREIFHQNNVSCCSGITMAQCHTLLEVESKENITITELSDQLMLNKSTTSRTIDGLVNVGLIDRDIPRENRRTTQLKLSDAGKKVCCNINSSNNSYFEKALSVLNSEEQAQFIALFEKVSKKMAELRGSESNDEYC